MTGSSREGRRSVAPGVRVAPPAALEIADLEIRYGSNHAVNDLNLRVAEGRTLAVLGSNGAGKTSLMRAVTGTLGFHEGVVHAGHVRLFGRDVTGGEPAAISRAGVALVPEGRRVFKEMTVEENLLTGALSLDRGISRREVLEEVYDSFSILGDRRTQAAVLLSGGEQQIMAIGRALMSRPRLLLIDEPSLGLAPVMIDRIAEVIAGIRKTGTTILLTEQNPSIALDLADQIMVLRVGSSVLTAAPDELEGADQLRDIYLGKDSAEVRPEVVEPNPNGLDGAAAAATALAGTAGGPTLWVDSVGVRFDGLTALDDVSFEVPTGSICAVIGPNGAGKSTLFNVVSGFYAPTSGTVRYGEHELTSMRPHQISGLGIARTFQNLELSDGLSVLENIMLGCHLSSSAGVLATALRLPAARKEERTVIERCREVAGIVGLEEDLDTDCGSLPYGVRKRVEIARALVGRPDVLLLDEPVAGMTADEVAEMQGVILRAHHDLGLTVMLIEHDIEFTLGLAHHVIVLDFGRVIARGAPAAIRQDENVHAAYLGSQAAATAATPSDLTQQGVTR